MCVAFQLYISFICHAGLCCGILLFVDLLLAPHMSRIVVCCAQDFAEKPKGDALESMKVDTTVLGEHGRPNALEIWLHHREQKYVTCNVM
jgi:hypothetical protein